MLTLKVNDATIDLLIDNDMAFVNETPQILEVPPSFI
ncbi:MAG: hypothetical protein MJA31_04870 [Clostridia bacterium]|nr:hypothetical protein [Clostridia bacterium]